VAACSGTIRPVTGSGDASRGAVPAVLRDGGLDAQRPQPVPAAADSAADSGPDPDLIAPVIDPFWVLGPGVSTVGFATKADDADRLVLVTSDYATATLSAGTYDVYRAAFQPSSTGGEVTPFLARRMTEKPPTYEVLWAGAPLAIPSPDEAGADAGADAGVEDARAPAPVLRDYALGSEQLVLTETQQIFAGFYTQRGARVRWVDDQLLSIARIDSDQSFTPFHSSRDAGAGDAGTDAGADDAGKPSDAGVADAAVPDALMFDAAGPDATVADDGMTGMSGLLLSDFSDPQLKRAYAFSIALTPSGNSPPAASSSTGLASDKPAVLDLSGYEVSFREEFDGPLDISNAGPGTRWTAHTPYNGDFGDAKFTDPAAAESPFSIRDGVLSIRAWFDQAAKHWRSGLLCSVDPKGDGFYQKYGYFEMRAKFPVGPGTWPAFWALTRDSLINKGKVDGFEADVVEQYGREPNVLHNVWHQWPVNGEHKGFGASWTVEDMTAGFHTYGFGWDELEMVWYFDRKELWRTATPDIAKRELYLLLNLAMGAGWPIDKTPDPSIMEVDYVRAFRKKP
jgi:Glycosyl hydrolases family 16